MKLEYIFDVDGTLTPSRGTIDPQFKKEFLAFARTHNVYLVTGSDRPKTLEQVGEEIYNSCKRVYNCSGCDVYEGSTNIRASQWILPEDAHTWLSVQLTESKFSLRTGLHFEHRPGMVNFSVVGRNANTDERARYVEYEIFQPERNRIAENFNALFPTLQARPGGDTGIDIAPLGSDKSQILVDFPVISNIRFYGDRTDVAGNDFPIASRLSPSHVYSVIGWEHTRGFLSNE
tara:strand:- start:589 stop:1284 length:696 start_codon:yes stop_codon:yes gene_type:complete